MIKNKILYFYMMRFVVSCLRRWEKAMRSPREIFLRVHNLSPTKLRYYIIMYNTQCIIREKKYVIYYYKLHNT